MEIIETTSKGKEVWNNFVRANYPPVGAFLQTFEWGEFQKSIGKDVERYAVVEKKETLASFMLTKHPLPFGFSYGYTPRGPVLSKKSGNEGMFLKIIEHIRVWTKKAHPKFLFFRLEPALKSFSESIETRVKNNGFLRPGFYVQPRFNHVVLLDKTEDEIIKGFHSSTRSNIKRAENRGVTVEKKTNLSEDDFKLILSIIEDTIKRTSGENAYPKEAYFRALIKTIPCESQESNPNNLSLCVFFGYQNGEPAAFHIVLFFGETATYLYGATYTDKLNSKVSTYLHYSAMIEAKKKGMKYYDLGAIDDKLWPTITQFKRQFRGKEFSYVGNIDISVRPFFHRAYNFLRRLRKS